MRRLPLIQSAILSAVMLLAIACGGDEANPSATATTAPPATVPVSDRATEPPPQPTAVPATSAPAQGGKSASLIIDVDGDNLKFNIDSLSTTAGSDVVVTFNNSSSVNSHNWAMVEVFFWPSCSMGRAVSLTWARKVVAPRRTRAGETAD